MSDIRELIEKFRRSGALIEFGGGNRVRFKPGAIPIPPGLLEELQARKAEVVQALAAAQSQTISQREAFIPVCLEFVGSRTILRHPGFACGRCGNRYDRHAEAGKASAPAETLEFLARLMRK